jgi:hypothetical protein
LGRRPRAARPIENKVPVARESDKNPGGDGTKGVLTVCE